LISKKKYAILPMFPFQLIVKVPEHQILSIKNDNLLKKIAEIATNGLLSLRKGREAYLE